MSYCRFSSMNWKCDIYAWEGASYTISVAGARRVGTWPDNMPFPMPKGFPSTELYIEAIKKWNQNHNHIMSIVGKLPLEKIDLPHAGETFECHTLEEFRDKLIMLRETGYLFPDYVFDRIEEEMKERHYEKILQEEGRNTSSN